MKPKFFLTTISIFLFLVLVPNANAQKKVQSETIKKIATPESSKNWMHLKKPMKQDEFLQNLKTVLDLDDGASFTNIKTETDDLSWTHYKVQQLQHGIPIEGAQYILHEKDGQIQKANGKLIKAFCKNEQPIFNKEEAIQKVLQYVNAEKYIWEDQDFSNSISKQKPKNHYPQPELVYVNPKFDDDALAYRLCYKLEFATLEPFEHYVYYINAVTGIVEHKINQIHNCFNFGSSQSFEKDHSTHKDAQGIKTEKNLSNKRKTCEEGIGYTQYDGTVNITTEFANGEYALENYCLDGPGEGIITQQVDNSSDLCCSSTLFDANNNWVNVNQKNAISVFWATELFYNYFWQYHNRNSTDGNGELLVGNINLKYPVTCSGDQCWTALYWLNQFWASGETPSYDAPVPVDIVTHEFTHGIISNTANLLYQNESGALNESFADIFGVVIERLMSPNLNGLDWLIGEDVRTIRDMSNPNQAFPPFIPQPDTYSGNNWWDQTDCNPSGFNDYCGVHINGGVQNYWFYLLTEGGSGTNDNGENYNVTGIGIVDAAKIAYRNLTQYLTSNSNYGDAENGSIQAAIDLFGANSNKVQQVKNAWCAVGGNCSNEVITITSPNGSEVVWGNAIQPIIWTTTNISSSENITIELSINNGGNWEHIATVPNTGSYNWEVPHLITDLAMVRITQENDFGNRDESNNLFKILGCSLESNFEIATNETQRCANSTITFNSLSTNTNTAPLFYKWRVNAGAVESTQSNFQKIFNNAGSYTINLEVHNATGCAASFSCPIYIKLDANADFIYDQEDSSYIVNFAASQADANSYNWTVNGTPVSTSKIFQYNFGNTGNYQVCLNINSNCGNANVCKSITIDPTNNCSINANYTINNNQICPNYVASFISTSTGGATIYDWYINGTFEKSASILFYTFPTAGEYIVSLVAKNNSGNCTDIISQIVNVNPEIDQLSKIPDIMNCSISSAIIDAGINNVLSYEWRLNGVVKGTNKVLTVFESGNYTLTITDQCGQNISEEVLVALSDQDCIRPGDFNNDGEVNSSDVIYYGIHYGDKIYEREEQGINWQNYAGLDWGQSLYNNSDIDMKYLDANGDGWVDLADWLALQKNWMLEHNGSNNANAQPNNATTSFNLNLVPNAEETVQSITGAVQLVLDLNVEGDQGNLIPLYAGYVTYDLNDIEQQIGQIGGQPTFRIDDDISWLTDGRIDHVSHAYLDEITNEFKIVFTRLDQQIRAGNGRIGQISIEIANIIPPGAGGSTEFIIEPTKIAFFNELGEQIPLGTSVLKTSTPIFIEDLMNSLNQSK